MVKKSETPAGTVPRHLSLGQGAWVVFTMRCGCLRWVEQLGAGLAAVAVNPVFFWELARMGFLTIRDAPSTLAVTAATWPLLTSLTACILNSSV